MSPERLFTPQSANRTLPLVRKIVADVLNAGRELKAIGKSTRTTDEKNAEATRLTKRMEELLAEFQQIGCFYKDWNFEIGLVDFPAVIDGRNVLLCWRSDEPAVKFFHGFQDGYAGRREIPERYFAEITEPAISS